MTNPGDASTNGSPTVSNASANASPDRLATVFEAAEILGITPDAVRSRLRRGTNITSLGQRIPELEAPAEGLRPEVTPEPRDAPATASATASEGAADGTGRAKEAEQERRSWPYRFFFGQ